MRTNHTRASGPSRRAFLTTAAATLAAPYIVPSSVFGANAPSNRLTMASIGIGGQGGQHLRNMVGDSDVQVLAVCDVDGDHRAKAKAQVDAGNANRAGGPYKACDAYNDFREVLARPDIDAVLIATPDHWHVPISLAAVKAGKDVYCEKPLTLTVSEGRTLCDTVKRYGAIFQVGSQQRSDPRFRFAAELARNGRLGKIHTIHVGLPTNNWGANLNYPAEPVPPQLDYDRWLGPAPDAPYTPHRVHYKFRFLLDYSGGQTTNFGAHDLDIAQWALGMDDSGPIEIDGRGSEFPTDGLYDVPSKYQFELTYASGTKVIVNNGPSGVRMEGTDGWCYVNRGLIQAEPRSLLTTTFSPGDVHLYDSKSHWGNFKECVRSRREPICPVEIGHRSATVCHLGTSAMRLQRSVKWDPAAERFVNDAEADRMLWRPSRVVRDA